MVPATLPATPFNFIYAPHMGEEREKRTLESQDKTSFYMHIQPLTNYRSHSAGGDEQQSKKKKPRMGVEATLPARGRGRREWRTTNARGEGMRPVKETSPVLCLAAEKKKWRRRGIGNGGKGRERERTVVSTGKKGGKRCKETGVLAGTGRLFHP
jgi:hypothetical protein